MTSCTLQKKVCAASCVKAKHTDCPLSNKVVIASGGKNAGVHGRSSDGSFFAIFESEDYKDETTGLAFSPDATQ